MTHYGRDFSSYQGNLTPADCQGIDFAYVKATEGDSYKNPYAIQQVQMLRSQGVKVGLYHFFQPGLNLPDQLGNLAAYAHALGDTQLPIAIDVEVSDPAGWQSEAHKIMQFVMGVEGWHNVVPNPRSILYVNETFYNALQPIGFPWGRWVWYARPSATTPDKPCLVWQSGQRPVAGAQVDFDQFMGSEADWDAFTLTSSAPGPVPGDGTSTVPGPNGRQLLVIGHVYNPGGVYVGFPALDGINVWAGTGSPTTWRLGWNAQELPSGTPLAVDYNDRAHIGPTEVTERL